jgi:hypothetical protein
MTASNVQNQGHARRPVKREKRPMVKVDAVKAAAVAGRRRRRALGLRSSVARKVERAA